MIVLNKSVRTFIIVRKLHCAIQFLRKFWISSAWFFTLFRKIVWLDGLAGAWLLWRVGFFMNSGTSLCCSTHRLSMSWIATVTSFNKWIKLSVEIYKFLTSPTRRTTKLFFSIIYLKMVHILFCLEINKFIFSFRINF